MAIQVQGADVSRQFPDMERAIVKSGPFVFFRRPTESKRATTFNLTWLETRVYEFLMLRHYNPTKVSQYELEMAMRRVIADETAWANRQLYTGYCSN